MQTPEAFNYMVKLAKDDPKAQDSIRQIEGCIRQISKDANDAQEMVKSLKTEIIRFIVNPADSSIQREVLAKLRNS